MTCFLGSNRGTEKPSVYNGQRGPKSGTLYRQPDGLRSKPGQELLVPAADRAVALAAASSSGCCPGTGRPSSSRAQSMLERHTGQTTLAINRRCTDVLLAPPSVAFPLRFLPTGVVSFQNE